jgi:hypothetical protein
VPMFPSNRAFNIPQVCSQLLLMSATDLKQNDIQNRWRVCLGAGPGGEPNVAREAKLVVVTGKFCGCEE